jgi:glycosyltransferase involved in cell wall biosynthesis
MRPEAPSTVIPSAAGLHLHREPPRAGVGDAVRTIGMLARIDRWKGQLELLEAFAQAFAGRPEIRLQFAGEPLFGHEPFLSELRRRTRQLELADRVDFLGQVEDVEALLSTWDVAVQASTRPEPLGQNVLQYLAAGRVVVAADEGGPAEWITDGVNGLLVAPRDVAALAAALGRLDTDDELRVRLATAAATTPGLLDDASVMQAHAEFYEVVVRARRAA